MNRAEYLSALSRALRENGVRDIEDIVGEYDEHFTYKLRDGFSEEEAAAKLGGPKELTGQSPTPLTPWGSRALSCAFTKTVSHRPWAGRRFRLCRSRRG